MVNAEAGGLEGLKLYGMVGVPGEGDDDVHATIDMMTTVCFLFLSYHFPSLGCCVKRTQHGQRSTSKTFILLRLSIQKALYVYHWSWQI